MSGITEIIRDRHLSLHFDSMLDLINCEPAEINKAESERRRNQVKYITGSEHYGPTISTYDDALRFSINGDHRLYEEYVMPRLSELQEHYYNAKPEVQTIKRKIKRRIKSDFGNEVDIHQVNQGNLSRAWSTTRTEIQDREHSLVTLLIEIGQNWHVNAIRSLWTSALACKLANDIQLSGKSLQILIGWCGLQSYVSKSLFYNGSIVFVAKRYNESLSVERLAAMTHLGFFRTLCFQGLGYGSLRTTDNLGYTTTVAKMGLPHKLKDEVDMGHTKVIVIPCVLGKNAAISLLDSTTY